MLDHPFTHIYLHERFGWAGSAGRKAEVENISNWEGWDKSNRCSPHKLAENESLGNMSLGKNGMQDYGGIGSEGGGRGAGCEVGRGAEGGVEGSFRLRDLPVVTTLELSRSGLLARNNFRLAPQLSAIGSRRLTSRRPYRSIAFRSVVINMLDHRPVRMHGVQALIERRNAAREHDALPSWTCQTRHGENLPCH